MTDIFTLPEEEKQYTLEELTKPIKTVEEKYKLLPHFLRLRGLLRQHIDSFNHFINVDMKEIVAAKSNNEVRSDADPKFFLRYTDIYIGNIFFSFFIIIFFSSSSSSSSSTIFIIFF